MNVDSMFAGRESGSGNDYSDGSVTGFGKGHVPDIGSLGV
jgi:membrane-bound inhibitor of C-type lysozyme